MGIKLYIKDDLGRSFTNLEWAISDTKFLSDILLNKVYLKTLKSFFNISIYCLDKVQYIDDIKSEKDKKWFDIKLTLEDIKKLKNIKEISSNEEILKNLNMTAEEIKDSTEWMPDFTSDYFIRQYFSEDLEDLERILYYLLHSGAKTVHLYCE